MEMQFIDRLLSCSDCHGEFIFTAGEQIFFYEKQFKNDPKRCKSCKSRRSGLAAVANGSGPAAAGLSRVETRTECSDCGIDTTVPFKPTQGRPVLCRQCFQAKNRMAGQPPLLFSAGTIRERATQGGLGSPLCAHSRPIAETISALTQVAASSSGATMSADEALMAASSMASASSGSSVASAADLASIMQFEQLGLAGEIPTELLAGAESIPVELLAARLEPAKR